MRLQISYYFLWNIKGCENMFGKPAKNIPFFICFVLSVVHLCGTEVETIPLKNIFGIIKTSLL